MRSQSRHRSTDETEVAASQPRRDALGAALRAIFGPTRATLPEEFEARLAKIDAAARNTRVTRR
jgi:hypothetical protein